MKQESHRLLGHHLLNLLQEQPKRRHTRAFLIGCVEPDRNPLSYLKGSIRAKWFYGHNYQNADRWIARHIRTLQAKDHWNLWNYYCMGKLIHYTSDAFTYVHNNCFTDSIAEHRAYENRLQEQFFISLEKDGYSARLCRRDLNEHFRSIHERYLKTKADVYHDCHYILNMTDWLFCQLFPEAMPAAKPVPAFARTAAAF